MVNAIPNLAPPPGTAEGATEAGKQTASASFSFTDALDAVLAGGGQAAVPTVPKLPETEDCDTPVVGSEIAAAVQAAMPMPVQASLPLPAEAAPEAVDDGSAESVSLDAARPPPAQVAPANGIPAGARPTTAEFARTPAVSDRVDSEPSVQAPVTPNSEALTEPNSVAPGPAPATAQPAAAGKLVEPDGSASALVASVEVTDVPAPAVAPRIETGVRTDTPRIETGVRTDAPRTETGVRTDAPRIETPARTDAPPSADRLIEQVQAAPDQAQSTDSEPAVPDIPKAAPTAEARPAPSAPTRIPIDAAPVGWRFEASSEAPKIVNAGQLADSLVQPVTASSAKPAVKEGEAPDQGTTSQQTPAPTGVGFAAQPREAARTAAPAAPTPDLHARVIDQVVRQVTLHRTDDRSDIVVKLNPPDLGNLRLQITQDASGMTTRIQTASSQVRGLLEAHMPLLIDSLAKAGVQMDSVSVSVGTSFNAFAQNARQQDAQPNSNQPGRQSADTLGLGGARALVNASLPAWGSVEQAGYSWLA